MDLQPTPFPGKSRPVNSKTNQKTVPESKISSKEAPINRKKRVFGTNRSTNISLKIVEEKPVTKPAMGKSQQQPKTHREIPSKHRVIQSQPLSEPKLGVIEESTNGVETLENNSSDKVTVSSPSIKAQEKNSSDKTKAKSKKNGCFKVPSGGGDANGMSTPAKHRVTQSQPLSEPKLRVMEESTNGVDTLENNSSDKVTVSSPSIKAQEKNSSDKTKAKSKKTVCFKEPSGGGDANGMSTPASSLIKRRTLGTPYHSAENCSKCKFDRLESSSYWLAQIKLAELVGKHFVAAKFFRLAFECNAEPVRTLRSELRRYLALHGSLSTETEWRDVSVSYGLLKDESNVDGLDSALKKADSSGNNSNLLDQEQQYMKEQLVGESQTELYLN